MPGGQNYFFDSSFKKVAYALCGYDEHALAEYLRYRSFDTSSMAIQELREPLTPLDPDDYSMRDRLLKRLSIKPEPKPRSALAGAHKAFEVFKALERLKAPRFAKTT